MSREEKDFENWAYDMWEDNCAEREAFRQPCYSFAEYVKKNECWLRAWYKKEQRMEA